MPYVRSRFIQYRRTRKYQPKRFRSLPTRGRAKNTSYRGSYRKSGGRFRGRTGRRRGSNLAKYTRYAKAAGTWAGAANNALHLARTVYALINPEFKFVDNNIYNLAVVSTSTTIDRITSIGQGVGPDQRTGNSVLLKYIKCTFNVKYGTANAPAAIRVTIVSNQDGTAPLASEVYEYTASGTQTVLSPWKKNSNINYKVWFDHVFHVDQYNPQMVMHKDLRSRGHHHLKYIGAAPTDSGPNNLWSLISTDVSGSGINPTISRLYRIGFLDN